MLSRKTTLVQSFSFIVFVSEVHNNNNSEEPVSDLSHCSQRSEQSCEQRSERSCSQRSERSCSQRSEQSCEQRSERSCEQRSEHEKNPHDGSVQSSMEISENERSECTNNRINTSVIVY